MQHPVDNPALSPTRPDASPELAPALMPPTDSPAGPSRITLLAYALVAAIALSDVFTPRINVAIFYTVPLILTARARRRGSWLMAALLVVLTYAGYAIKWHFGYNEEASPFFSYRLINRSFVAVALLLLSASVPFWFSGPASPQPAPGTIPPAGTRYSGDDFDQLFRSLLPAISFVAAAIAAAVVATVDLIVPSNVNLPILYIVPLFVFGWTRSRMLVWMMTVLLLLLTALGYMTGPAPHVSAHAARLVPNRFIAGAALILVAALIHSSVTRRPQPR